MVQHKASLASNPIRRAREGRQETLGDFASKCGVHLQALYGNESGVFPYILPSVMHYLVKVLRMDQTILIQEYREFIKEKRQEFESKYCPYSLPAPVAGESPIAAWRESLGLSRAGLSKELCVQPSVLYRLETKKTSELPNQLLDALKAVNFPIRLIEELEYRNDEFFFN